MKKYLTILRDLEKSMAPDLMHQYGLTCKAMQNRESSVLYVAKKRWTNRLTRDESEDTIGVFFSIWTNDELLRKKSFSYNIHSLKLRLLPRHKLKSREFAEEFRTAVRGNVKSWPNVCMSYGPLTLLEGFDGCELDGFREKCRERVEDFAGISGIVDALLSKGRH